MEYDDNYKLAMDAILHVIEKEKEVPQLSTDSKRLVKKLYKDITDGIEFAKKTVTEDNVKLIPLNKFIYPTQTDYMSDEIKHAIRTSMAKQMLFESNILGRKIRITVGLMSNKLLTTEEVVMSIRQIVSWLFVCHKYSSSELCKTLTIETYFTDIKKGFPNSNTLPLDYSHVNTGVSMSQSDNGDSSIIIFRYEEWFKVFIHECGHSYGCESHDSVGNALSSFVNSLISIKVSTRIGEAYVETWARIAIVFYSSIANSINYDDFLSLLRFNMKVESIFSAIQAYRILAFMNIPYTIVIDPMSSEGKLYKESTNVFAYYILCGSFMQNPFKFLSLFNKHNTRWLQINNDRDTIQAFEKYIKESLYNSEFEKLMLKFSPLANRKIGLRFTITELPKK